MTSHLPAWTAFDPGAPPALSDGGALPGRVVALVAGEGAMRSGWVGEVALDLAASWGVETGGRVVTADAGFQAPSLRYAADLPPGEGFSDLLLWGGSLQRVARPNVRGGFVVTAGTPIADGSAALATPRWGALCAGCREAGVTLVVLTPASELGVSSIVAEARDVVILAAADEDAGTILADGTDKVRATLGVAPRATPSAPPATEDEPGATTAAAPAASRTDTPPPARATSRSGDVVGPSRTVYFVAAVVIIGLLLVWLLLGATP